MRINPNSAPNEAGLDGLNGTTGGKPSTSAASPVSDDRAELSYASLAAQVTAMPEVRQERVAALRQAIANGSYHVEPQQIAHALFAELLTPGEGQ